MGFSNVLNSIPHWFCNSFPILLFYFNILFVLFSLLFICRCWYLWAETKHLILLPSFTLFILYWTSVSLGVCVYLWACVCVCVFLLFFYNSVNFICFSQMKLCYIFLTKRTGSKFLKMQTSVLLQGEQYTGLRDSAYDLLGL